MTATTRSVFDYLWGSTSFGSGGDIISNSPSVPYASSSDHGGGEAISAQLSCSSEGNYLSLTVGLLVTATALFYAYIQVILQPRIQQLEHDDEERRRLLDSAAKLVNDSNRGEAPQSDAREAPEGTALKLYAAANVQEGSLNALVPLVREWRGNSILNWRNPDQDLASPLIAAAGWGNTDVVWLLVSSPGIDLNVVNSKGRSAFAMACWNGSLEVAKILAGLPATDVNLADEDGTTPIMWAIENSHVDIVRLLVSLPAIDLNKADKNGLGPIHCAAQEGHVEVVRLLLSHPLLIVNKVDGASMTALQYASMRGFENVEDLLRPRAAR